jgi:4-methylaminobutanoate oxidase (formaldehyde-forming)
VSDVTVARLAEERFYLVTGSAFGTRDLAWLRTHIKDERVSILDTTPAYSVVHLVKNTHRRSMCLDPIPGNSSPNLPTLIYPILLFRSCVAKIFMLAMPR